MATLPNISKLKINEAIKRLPKPIQAHLRRCRKLAMYVLERVQTEDWFLELNLKPEYLISAVAVHDVGKGSIPKEAYYLAHCKSKKQLEQYYSHSEKGVALVEEACGVTLSAYKETSFGGVLYRVLSEHHKFDDTHQTENVQNLSFASNFCAVIDLFDNSLFVGTSGEIDLFGAVAKVKEGIDRGLDRRIVSALVDDLQALENFVHYIHKQEDKSRKDDREQYGIGLRYERVMEITSNKVSAYRVKLIVNDPYYGVMRAEQLLPVAEKTGQVFRFEKIAFEKLCILLEVLAIRGIQIPNIIFPISAYSLERKTFFKDYGAMISKYRMPANRLCFGVSEQSINDASLDLAEKINGFSLMGCRFSIEDFGDQVSLIESVGEHQIDSITFKSSYGKKIATDTKTSSIVAGLAVIAERLGIRVILDGIENQNAELNAVRTGIRYASGLRYGEEITDKELVAELNS